MFRSLHIAATGMAAQETNLDAIANNLANANTAGYKRQSAEFEDLLYQSTRTGSAAGTNPGAQTAVQLGAGARVVSTSRSFSQGAAQQTNNPLDLAIEGNGFLTVQRPTGELAFTRAGNLRLDSQGQLVTNDGLPLEPPIVIPADATAVTIAADGSVSATQAGGTGSVALGQIQLATFANPEGLSALGHNLLTATPASGDPLIGAPGSDSRGTLLQGSLEQSNVEVVDEMIGMIRTQRAYEINSKVVNAADEMLRRATDLR